ncbi:hypothetical protein B1R32_13411 [Abditibacterium utsteinense]|uniref:Uncharacterized protein n=2 Tax=Abditibacterium utsteinense TaxID=1960156 RepID=A0A2S8SNT4_9BACT|nr:hypothetical protein B1R32_13411 [Abditibacterium utsteinense]
MLLFGAWFAVEVLPWKMGPSPPPPTEAFHEVLGQPVPEGVSNLVVVNRQYVIKSWYWMSFRASDRALASLLRPGNLSDGGWVEDRFLVQLALQGVRGVGHHKYDSVDKQTVGWDRVLKLRTPEVYRLSFFSESDGFSWYSDVIVDRKGGWVYILASS